MVAPDNHPSSYRVDSVVAPDNHPSSYRVQTVWHRITIHPLTIIHPLTGYRPCGTRLMHPLTGYRPCGTRLMHPLTEYRPCGTTHPSSYSIQTVWHQTIIHPLIDYRQCGTRFIHTLTGYRQCDTGLSSILWQHTDNMALDNQPSFHRIRECGTRQPFIIKGTDHVVQDNQPLSYKVDSVALDNHSSFYRVHTIHPSSYRGIIVCLPAGSNVNTQ